MPNNKKPRHAMRKRLPCMLSENGQKILKDALDRATLVVHVTLPMGKASAEDAQVMCDLVNAETTLLLARDDLDPESVAEYFFAEYMERRDKFFDWVERGVATNYWVAKGDETTAIRELFTDIHDDFSDLMSTEKGCRKVVRAILANRQIAPRTGKLGRSSREYKTIKRIYNQTI